MPPPFSADEDSLSLTVTDELYAKKAGSSTQSFDCNKLSCHYVSTQSGVDYPPPSDAATNTPLVRLSAQAIDLGDSGGGEEYSGAFTVSTEFVSGNLTERLKVTQHGAIAFSGDSGSANQVLYSRGPYAAPEWREIPPVESQYDPTSASAVSNSALDEHMFNTYLPRTEYTAAAASAAAARSGAAADGQHIFITGVAKNVMNTEESYVQWTGEPDMSNSQVESLLLPVGIRLKRLTIRWYMSSLGVTFSGDTTLPVYLYKYSTSFTGMPVTSSLVYVGMLYEFTAANTVGSHPAVNVDVSTANNGQPFELAAGESMIVSFERNIGIGHNPPAAQKVAETQVCVYAELLS